MKVNPDKFQALAVGEKTFALEPVFKIGEAKVECKDFGVEIDSHCDSNLMSTFLQCAGKHNSKFMF